MRFRFFRPLHGWREFIHEIVIVVIGVLLALAGAQVIENMRWQWQVQSARQSIANEIASNAAQAAMRLAAQNSRNPIFFVFSDDIPWAREPLGRLGTCVFVDQNSGAASEDLRLMSACKHQIIANSSFSWWAAWLNTNPNKMVVAPRNWLAKPADTFRDVFAAGWTTL